jgi:MFS family permease
MSPFFGGSIYVWGSIISSFMLHMSIGYFIGGHLSAKTRKVFPLIISLCCASVYVFFIPYINRPISAFVSELFLDVRVGSLIVMFILFFVPILIMAMTSPYLITILIDQNKNTKFSAGIVLFISTIGSFVGTNLTAFYLINLYKISDIIRGLGLVGFMISLFAICLKIDKGLKKS